MLRYAALLILTLVTIPTFVHAQDSGTPEERRACRGDFVKFCKTIPDEQKIEIANCLASHRAPPGARSGKNYLSPACDAVLRSHGF